MKLKHPELVEEEIATDNVKVKKKEEVSDSKMYEYE
jgi:hypothetical protein